MKKNYIPKITPKRVLIVAIHFVYIVALFNLYSQVQILKDAEQSTFANGYFFNARTNNLRECLKHQDFECPEGKYVDAHKIRKDIQAKQ